MGTFDRQIATAKRLIEKNGQKITWRKLAKTTPDTDKPWIVEEDGETDYDNISIVFLPNNRQNNELIRYITGTEVTCGNVQGLMWGVPFTPSADDIVIRDGIELRIKSIDTLSPNGQIILHTIEFDQ